MNEKNIIKRSAKDLKRGRTDFERLRAMTDEEIEAAALADEDAVPIDIDWSDAEFIIPPVKKPVNIRLDEDILDFFKAQGAGYQTRINAVLRHYVEHQSKPKKTG